MPAGSVMSWRQSKVVTRSADPSVGMGVDPGVEERGVGDARLGLALAGPLERVLRDVVARARGWRGRPRRAASTTPPAPQPTSMHRRARRAACASTPSRAGSTSAAGWPASTARSRGRCPRRSRAVGVVVEPEAGAEALGQQLERGHRLREVVEACPCRRPGGPASASTATASGESDRRSSSSICTISAAPWL